MQPVRGCGKRVKGGIYAECRLAPYGQPVEFFLLDPPVKVDAQALGISPIGVKMIEYKVDSDKTAWHVFDWVGDAHYTNVADFIEETRRFGLSRRLSRAIDFSKLTNKSKIILVHSHAWIDNFLHFQMHRAGINGKRSACPKQKTEHEDKPEKRGMCAGLWWEDIYDGVPAGDSREPRAVNREMPSFTYSGYMPPLEAGLQHSPAIFASFPISNLCVVRNPEDPKDHQRAYDVANGSDLHVTLEDE